MSSSKLSLIKSKLEEYPLYQDRLFVRGYLVTDAELPDIDSFPFYGKWQDFKIGSFIFRIHNKQSFHYQNNGDVVVFLIGNCVDPYDMEFDDEVVTKRLSDSLAVNKTEFLKKVNQLTGSFVIGIIKGASISFLRDPVGMLYAAYGVVNERFYLSSHSQLLDDLLDLTKNDYIRRLEKYRFFNIYGISFPGDITQFSELKRAIQNHIITYDGSSVGIERFYPAVPLNKVQTEEEYNSLLEDAIDLINKTLLLCTKKWKDKKIAVSLSGGMDSKVTFACAKGLYDKIEAYTFVSLPGEKIDAEVAVATAKAVGAKHTVYDIPQNDDEFDNIETDRLIIEHNKGDYRCNPNDVRKRRFFSDGRQFDVEIRSWASEVARAKNYSRYGLRKSPRIDSRRMTSMYKLFITQRRLANETSKIFGDFIRKSRFNDIFLNGYDELSMFHWEFRDSSWGGLGMTSEHCYSNDVFVPFNNRNLLDLLLKCPDKKKISDEHYHDLIGKVNPEIEQLGLVVKNWNNTRIRAFIEKLNFKINSVFTKKY